MRIEVSLKEQRLRLYDGAGQVLHSYLEGKSYQEMAKELNLRGLTDFLSVLDAQRQLAVGVHAHLLEQRHVPSRWC